MFLAKSIKDRLISIIRKVLDNDTGVVLFLPYDADLHSSSKDFQKVNFFSQLYSLLSGLKLQESIAWVFAGISISWDNNLKEIIMSSSLFDMQPQ